jgi:hypothetical protein
LLGGRRKITGKQISWPAAQDRRQANKIVEE